MTYCVLACFKNESHIIDEWIQHYLNEGADQIILIDNNSDDNWRNKIKEKHFSNPNIIFVEDKRVREQCKLYNTHVKNAKTKWVLICDMDEFLYSRLEYNTIKEYLETVPDDISSISIPMITFGSMGKKKQPDSVIQGFTQRGRVPNGRLNTKMIVRVSEIEQLGVHKSSTKSGSVIDMKGKISEKNLKQRPLQLNHYSVQSKDYFMNCKLKRGINMKCAVRDDNGRSFLLEKLSLFDLNDIKDTELANKVYK